MTVFLMIFRRFPTTFWRFFRRFLKIFSKARRMFMNIFRKFLKIANNFQGRPEDVLITHQQKGISNDWACKLGRNRYFVGKWYDKAWALGASIMGNDAIVYKRKYSTWSPSRPSEPTVNLWLMPSFLLLLVLKFILFELRGGMNVFPDSFALFDFTRWRLFSEHAANFGVFWVRFSSRRSAYPR